MKIQIHSKDLELDQAMKEHVAALRSGCIRGEGSS